MKGQLMSSYEARPWQNLYPAPLRQPPARERSSVLDAFLHSARHAPGAAVIKYFDREFSVSEVNELSDVLAAALAARGTGPGDRIALHMQNMPQFVIAAVAAWKLGAMIVPLNPMLRGRELLHQLRDSGASVLIALDSLYGTVGQGVLPDTAVRLVVTTSALDFQTRDDSRLFAGMTGYDSTGSDDLLSLLREHEGQRPPAADVGPDDIAMLTYTSGTTGIPKAATNSHANLLFNAQTTRDWMELDPTTAILGIAPLFHITGLVCQLVTSLLTPAPLVLSYRFEPEVMLSSIREHSPAFAVGAVTAFVALLGAPSFARADFASFQRVYSGGAPVSPATARAFEDATGHQLHGAFGMTESSAPTHFAPFGIPSRVDATSGALTIGIPTPGTLVRILDDAGAEVPPGEPGEMVIEGPQVVAGYWHRPEETAATIREGRLYSGDIAVMDEQGWFYIVDRKKDVIISSGFKVWPREVEDVLTEHPSVREAAVIGVPEAYRGETVKAFVSLHDGATVTPEELIAFAGERLSAYKRPRMMVVLPSLPKTVSGKILRRELRDQHIRGTAGEADSAAWQR
jgi:long-chain acyl-CoA synthetase